MQKKLLLVLGLFILIILLGFVAYRFIFVSENEIPAQPTPAPTVIPTQTAEDDIYRIFSKKGSEIQITRPTSFDSISSPLVIEGKARGNWFFEGSFPVRIVDMQGNLIAEVPAQSTEDWMTQDWVNFKTRIEFGVIQNTPAKIIFAVDNPSGLPENDDQAEIETVLLK